MWAVQQGEDRYLLALLLRLQPRMTAEAAIHRGQTAHDSLLEFIGALDPVLERRLREPDSERPFTCSTLLGVAPVPRVGTRPLEEQHARGHLSPRQTCWLRLTLLDEGLFRTFLHRFLGAPSARAWPLLRFGGVECTIVEPVIVPVGGDVREWANHTSFEALVNAARAVQGRATAEVTLEFASPTVLARGTAAWGRHLDLLPDPVLIFERLARVWNVFAPIALALDTRAVADFVRSSVIVARHQLETRAIFLDQQPQAGFMGFCTYRAMTDPGTPIAAGLRPRQWLHLLAAFAYYAGIGQDTTLGMGRARVPGTILTRAKPDGYIAPPNGALPSPREPLLLAGQ
jgi:CRISPR-associated endoribonuclease Cas6